MSSPAQGGPSAPKEKKGASRVLSRMKTIMKKRMSISGPSDLAKPSDATATASTSAAAPATAAVAATAGAAAAAPAVASGAKGKGPEVAGPEPTKVPRMQLHEERARKLGERFGLEIKPSEWHSTEGNALRVNKPIRMRVHRVCHECKTEFSSGKECPSCKHLRCKKCTRYPPKRTEAEKLASRERRAALLKEQKENPPIIADWNASHSKKLVLTKPSKKPGQDLVYKKPRQRLRRTCCQCEKLFIPHNKTCESCGHNRCTDCPRDPAKKDKYPYGYPGDEFGARSIPRYKCHSCKTKFPTDAAEGAECTNCAHPRCKDCPRIQPHRVDPEPDPEILKTIESRLSKLKVG